jgi:hypothetical protein
MDVDTQTLERELKSLRAEVAKTREEVQGIRTEFYKALILQTTRIGYFGLALLLINQLMNRY